MVVVPMFEILVAGRVVARIPQNAGLVTVDLGYLPHGGAEVTGRWSQPHRRPVFGGDIVAGVDGCRMVMPVIVGEYRMQSWHI